MTVHFQSTPLLDLVIYSGIDIKYECQLQNTPLRGDIEKKALADLKQSYDDYKSNLHFKYGQFLKRVENNIVELKRPEMPNIVRHAIACKLSDLAKRRIEVKESHYSGLHKFFHKVGQWFQGHGFRTKAEWGLLLASRIEKVDLENYKAQLQKCITRGPGVKMHKKSSREIINEMKSIINGLPDDQFKELLTDVYFKHKETDFFFSKNKFAFYQNLDPAKRGIFDRELLSRKDWYEQAFDIIEGANDQDLQAFVSKEMVSLFKADPKKIIDIHENNKNPNGWSQKFFQMIVEKSVQEYVAQNTPEAYLQVAKLLHDPNIKASEILKKPLVLTPEQVQQLKNNIDIF